MKNKKKILAILVALIMTMTCMFAMTGTAYADAELEEGTLTLFTYYDQIDLTQSCPKGITYSKSNNTVTFNNYKGADDLLVATGMGSSLKIKIKGTCSLGNIEADNTISFTGTGKITINKNKTAPYGVLISNSSNKKAHVTIGKSLTTTIYGVSNEWYTRYPIEVNYNGSNSNTAAKAIVINAKKTKGSVKKSTEKQEERINLHMAIGEKESITDVAIYKNADGKKFAAVPFAYYKDVLQPTWWDNPSKKVCLVDYDDITQDNNNNYWLEDYTKYKMLDALPDGYKISKKTIKTCFHVSGTVLKTVPKK